MLRFVGVLGWPLEHTLSPVIHAAAFRALRLDWVYLAWPVPPEELAQAIGGLRALGAAGANVTMPHKETVIEYLDKLSGDARAVGAVNTIQMLGDQLIGHNTDVDGFRAWLVEDAGLTMGDRSALVLGAGGAARAAVAVLDELGATSIAVAARDRKRAESLVGSVGASSAHAVDWHEARTLASTEDVIVNATPLGMRGENALEGASFHPSQAVLDLVYDPSVTPLVGHARSAGASAWGGLGMLVHQAAASLQIWTGQDPPTEAMSAAALHSLGRRSATGPQGSS
jgi:shikimate dehydrogenase